MPYNPSYLLNFRWCIWDECGEDYHLRQSDYEVTQLLRATNGYAVPVEILTEGGNPKDIFLENNVLHINFEGGSKLQLEKGKNEQVQVTRSI